MCRKPEPMSSPGTGQKSHTETASALSVDSNADVYANKRCWLVDYPWFI
jgi:hypothetical protein